MSFTVDEFHDLIRILEQEPDWRVELRRLLLSEELLGLPQLVRELVEAQRRTEERVGGLQQTVEALAEAQRRTGQHLAQLAEAQRRTEETVKQLVVDVGGIKGLQAERKYQDRAHAYFRPIVLRAHALSPDERVALIETAVDSGQLTDQEAGSLMLADVLVRGRLRDDQREVYLVVEVSWGVGTHDVRRASERAALLAKIGVEAIPVVAGDRLWPEAEQFARDSGVWRVTDGQAKSPSAD